jgi:8-oxo-dGTP pyrophosphatase MutT (NUDIX family)
VNNDRESLPPITDEIKRTWRRSRLDSSSGGVAYRRLPSGVFEIALIATRGGQRWQLPKGSCETGESSIQTALREVEEEVGLLTKPIKFLQMIDFWYWDTYRKEVPELVHKQVDFWLLEVVDGVISDASHEVDDAAWCPIQEALDVLTFSGERRVTALAISELDGINLRVDDDSGIEESATDVLDAGE